MLTRYDPWRAFRHLDELSRAYDGGLARNDDASSVVTGNWRPAVDIKEEGEQFLIAADVPGVDPEQIEVTMENGALTIKGERTLETTEEGNSGYRRVERAHGTFYRRFSLPDTADAEKIAAKVSHGVLLVEIPKKAALQPKRIKVAA